MTGRDLVPQRPTEGRGRTASGQTIGYWVALLGTLLFVASCFLPYLSFADPAMSRGETPPSLYEIRVSPGVAGIDPFATALSVFGGAAVIGIVVVICLRQKPRWGPPALAGAVAVWAIEWASRLVTSGSFASKPSVGFWGIAASITITTVGAVLAFRARRDTNAENGN